MSKKKFIDKAKEATKGSVAKVVYEIDSISTVNEGDKLMFGPGLMHYLRNTENATLKTSPVTQEDLESWARDESEAYWKRVDEKEKQMSQNAKSWGEILENNNLTLDELPTTALYVIMASINGTPVGIRMYELAKRECPKLFEGL